MSWTWFSLGILPKEDSSEWLNAPKDLTWEEAWSWLEDTLASPGSEGCLVSLGVGYYLQCNLGFDAKEIKTIHDAGASFNISCYEEDKEMEGNETKSK